MLPIRLLVMIESSSESCMLCGQNFQEESLWILEWAPGGSLILAKSKPHPQVRQTISWHGRTLPGPEAAIDHVQYIQMPGNEIQFLLPEKGLADYLTVSSKNGASLVACRGPIW